MTRTIRNSNGSIRCTIEDDGTVRDSYGACVMHINGSRVTTDGGKPIGSYEDGEFRNACGALTEPDELIAGLFS